MSTFGHGLYPLELSLNDTIRTPATPTVRSATLDDPALHVITDLRSNRVMTIAPETSIEVALQVMITRQSTPSHSDRTDDACFWYRLVARLDWG